MAEGTGVEPVSPCGHWFSKPAHYRPAHPPASSNKFKEPSIPNKINLKNLLVLPPGIGPGSTVPQTAILSIKL